MNRTTIKHLSKIILRFSVAMFLLLGLTAQANAQLEYMVRENTTNTNAVPSSEFSFGWNAQTHASGTAVTYDLGEFHINTGKYLVLYTQEWETTDTTSNTRKEIQGRLAVDGTTIDAGASQCYIRKTGGDQSCVTAGNAVLDITSDYTTLETLFYRTDDNATGIPTRENAGQNGVQIIKLGDDWNYGRYSLSTTQDTTLSATVFDDVVWDTTDEEDTGFTRSGSGITIADAGRYLVSYSLPVQMAESSTRTDVTSRLALDGVEVEGTRVSTYLRGSESTSNGVLNYVGVIDVAAGDVLKVQEILTSGAQVTYQGGSIEIVQLPSGAKTFIREATTGDQNPASLTEFSWDTTAHIDTDTFTINSATDSFTEVDSAGDYLFFWSAWTDSSSATRGKPSAALSVNDALIDYGLSARYHRANGTDNRAGHSNGAFVPSMSAGDDVSVEVVGLSAAGTMNVSHGAHSGLRLDTLYASAEPTTTSISGNASIPFFAPITGATVIAAVATSTPSLHTAVTDGSGNFTITGIPASGGNSFTARSAAGNDDDWLGVAYGNGMFVAVGDNGGDKVMTSPDGVTWTARSAAGDNDEWKSVAYGNGMFVAVGDTNYALNDAVMTSPDGITWTIRYGAAGGDDSWQDVTYHDGLFVAVGDTGGDDRVMTSSDGITWTGVFAADSDDDWQSVTYGNGLFVAVGKGGDDRVMTSPDGQTWTARSAAGDNDWWNDVVYDDGLFVAVSDYNDRVMTSPDGITWTARSAAGDNDGWTAVTHANGRFMAVGYTGDRAMYSSDGITWTPFVAAGGNDFWYDITYGKGKYVAVGISGDLVMTADAGFGEDTPITIFLDDNVNEYTSTALIYGRNEPATITGIDLSVDNFDIQHFDGVGVVDLSNADFYDADDDADILFDSDTGTTTISASTLRLQNTDLYAPQKLVLPRNLNTLNNSEFYAERGEVLLTGTSQDFYINATTTFFDLTSVATSARTLTFDSGDEVVVEGELILSGTEGGLITVESSSSGSEFYIRPNGAVTTEYLNVNDSHNISTVNTSLDCTTGCVDGGNNVGWSLPLPPAITGTLYEADGVTAVTTGKTVVAAVGTSTPSLHSVTTDGSGNFSFEPFIPSAGGETWSTTPPADDYTNFGAITYGNGQFVAVSTCYWNSASCVETSPDGVTWTERPSAENDVDGEWYDVTYGNGLFVAVGDSGDRIMTSPDGITWTARSAAGDNDTWLGVTYGNGRFVAVANNGDYAMYSDDGITWTVSPSVVDGGWESVTYADGQFVAVATFGFGPSHHVMTSPDGEIWTGYHAAEDNNWQRVVYGNGTYVAVTNEGTTRAMTSPDGQVWTARSIAGNDDGWVDVTYANGVFVAVADCDAGGDCVATSPDGVTWTVQTAAANSWRGVAAGAGKFVAVGAYDGPNRVMYSDAGFGEDTPITLFVDGDTEKATALTYGMNNSASVSDIDLIQGVVSVQHPVNSGEVDLYDFYNYDFSDDSDVLHAWVAGGSGTTSYMFNNLNVAADTTLVAPQQLIVAGSMTVDGEYEASRGTFYFLNDSATTTHRLDTASTITFHDFYAAAYFDGTAIEFKFSRDHRFEGVFGTIDEGEMLIFESSNPGYQYLLQPNGVTDLSNVYVQDANNVSSINDPIDCTTGCVDGGNNEGWEFPGIPSITGTLYESDGVTPLVGKTITAAVGTSTPSLHSATTNGSGNYIVTKIASSTGGTDWTGSYVLGSNDEWYDVIYGNGLFVAVGGFGDRVMTSPDGVTWTARSAAGNNDTWRAVAYGNGTFVAVGDSGDRVMTSPDGITWTVQSAVGDDDFWQDITFGNGLFVAVSYSGDHVMTSPDGINWTARFVTGDGFYATGITYGAGRFVVVASDEPVAVSTDGITWSLHSASGNNDPWADVAYGNGLFVAVRSQAYGNEVMTSPDGETWTNQTVPGNHDWNSVTYANGVFVAVGNSEGGEAVTSPDGINWTVLGTPTAVESAWQDVTYGNGVFVAVSNSGNTVMTADAGFGENTPITLFVDGETENATTLTYGRNDAEVVTGVELTEGTVRLQHSSTTGEVDMYDFYTYDSTDDADVLHTWLTEEGGVTSFMNSDLIVASNTTLVAPQQLAVTGGVTIDGQYEASRGAFYMTNGFATTTHHLDTSATTTFHNFYSLAYFDGSAVEFTSGEEYVIEGLLELAGTDSKSLSVEASSPGSEFYIRPNGAVTTEYLTVKDSYNISSVNTSIDCTTGCADGGNNSGWNIPLTDLSVTGVVYQADGITPLTGKTVTAAVGTSTPSLHSATTDGSGEYVIDLGAPYTSVATWATSSMMGDDDDWTGYAYGNGVHVIVARFDGGNGKVGYSTDGINWTQTSAAGDNGDWYGVTYGNGLFVAVGDSTGTRDSVMTSPDGINWTARSAVGDNDNWTDVAYGDGVYVAIARCNYSGDDCAMTSSDGITWTSVTMPSGNDDEWAKLAYGDDRFVAIQNSGPAGVSTDGGQTWTEYAMIGNNENWSDITYGNGKFVAVSNAFGGNDRIAYSADGTSWTSADQTSADTWLGVAYGNGLYVAVGNANNHTIAYSSDAVSWTKLEVADGDDDWGAFGFGGGRFMAFGNADTGADDNFMYANAGFGEGTPITLFVDGETEKASALTYGRNEVGMITGINLVEDSVFLRHSSTTGTINFSRTDIYDATDDVDVLFTATGGTTTVTGDLVVDTNTTLLGPQNLDLKNDLTINGTFAAQGGEVLLTGGDQTITTSATTTFYDFTAATTSARTLTFTSGEEYVFEGVMTLTGASGQLTSLNASTPDSEYFFRPNAVATAEYLDVQDSHNISTTTAVIECGGGCVDSGNVSGWNFPVTNITLSGTLFESDGSTPVTSGKTVTAAVGVSTPSLHSATTDGSGNYTIDIGAPAPGGTVWSTATPANAWDELKAITYGGGQYVAVSTCYYAGGNCAVTSPDGETWTGRSVAPADGDWHSVTYGADDGLYVAVGHINDYVMTSPDGITWTPRSAAGNDDQWNSITYGNGRFVAVANTGDYAMYSDDGITWTVPTTVSGGWDDVTYGNGQFVAVATFGFGDSEHVMTSPDGVTWTAYHAAEDNDWRGVRYGNGVYVAVANQGTNRAMTSPDGQTWTARSIAGNDDDWQSLEFADGVFVAVADCDAGGDCVATSPDGITWTVQTAPANSWRGVAAGDGKFVAVGAYEGPDRVMYSESGLSAGTPITLYVNGETEKATTLTYGLATPAEVSGMDLYQDTVRLQYASTTGTVDVSNIDFYDASDDADILLDVTATTTTVAADLIVHTNTELQAPQKLELQNDLTINGTFAAQGGEVLLTGGDQTITTSATTTFYDFTAATTSARTLTFTSGEEYVFAGELVLSGANGNLTSLVASTPDSEYFFRPNATATAEYLDVQDSHNISTTMTSIDCTGRCISGGNNSGWAVITMDALAATDISVSTATLNGDVLSSGGLAVINRGFIYSTESDFSSNVATSSESSSYNISSAVFEGIALDVSPQESAPYAMLFNDDGTVLYVMGVTQDDIRSYDLSVAYDISSAVYDEIVLDVSPQETVPTDMLFNDDGTVLYVLGYSSDNVNAYTLSVAYDVSTAVFDSVALDVVSEGVPKGMTFNDDGTVLYVMGSAQDNIRSYNLSVAYDISSAVHDGVVLDVSPQETNPYSLLFNDDGTALYVIGFMTDTVHTYSLSVPFDVSSAVYESVALDVSSQEGAPAEIMFNNDGTRLYVTGEGDDEINAYTLTFAEGVYSRDITSLEGGTTYYARAFAENSFGVAYSTTTVSFTTDVPAVLDIADNDAGQVSDAFSFQNKTDTELFAFKLSTTTVGLTVTEFDIALTGIKSVTANDIQNVELYVDVDGDAEYDDGLDTLVGTGVVTISGVTGNITFATDFAIVGAVNYLVIGDTVSIENGSFITFNLFTRDIEVEGGIASGAVSSIQHSRNNRGGGGGSVAAIVDEVIPGDGDVGGGSSGGGGEIDTNTGGALIGNNPNFKAPTSHVGSWTNPEYAYDNTDGTYATTSNSSFNDYTSYVLGVPGSNTIQGIEVKLELSGTTAAGTVDVQLSWDNRRTWTSVKTTPVLTTTDAVVSLGGSSDLWGRTWADGDFNTGNFAIRLVGSPSSNTIRVDEIRVRVYHQATGGGGGGGGGAI